MPRVVGILAIGGGLILISWVTSPAALTTPPGPRVSPTEVEQAAQAVTPLTSQVDDQAARLRARLAAPPPKPDPERNPFRFGDTSPAPKASSPAKRAARADAPSVTLAAPVITPLALPSLIAITTDATAGGIMRTAALSMNDELRIVRPGQMFDRFMVESIGADSVRLVDITSPTRATFVIAIR